MAKSTHRDVTKKVSWANSPKDLAFNLLKVVSDDWSLAIIADL